MIYEELVKRNLEVDLAIDYKRKEVELAELMDYVYNRDISVLTLIGETDYQARRERMEKLIKENPTEKVTADFAEMFVVARKI